MFKQIQLDKKGEQHLYIQLYHKLKRMIEEGILEENQKLPPIRQMAEMLEVNNVTVVNAYKLLEEEGLVYKRVGSGTYVAPALSNIDREDINSDDEIQLMNQGQLPLKQNVISFATATPAPELFPIGDVKKAINYVLDRDGGEVFGYQDSLGYLPLREAFSNYLRKKDIICNVMNIQVVSGAQQGIDIISKALLEYGDVVFTEEPTYSGAISAFKSRGARIVTIPIYQDGIDIEVLKEKLSEFKPKFFYTMTTFQNPTGYSYSEEKKYALLEISKKYGLPIVEDDSLSELYFTQSPSKPLRAYDSTANVIYIKSFSKIFLPGFRIAFLIMPERLVNQVMAAKHISDISSSGLIQRTFDFLLRNGLWEKHLAGMRKIYLEKYNFFIKLLKEKIPSEVKYHLPEGGLNFWLTLPLNFSSNILYRKCLAEGVIIVPGSLFFPDGGSNNSFRLSIAAVEEEKMVKGINILIKVINELLSEEEREENISFTPLV